MPQLLPFCPLGERQLCASGMAVNSSDNTAEIHEEEQGQALSQRSLPQSSPTREVRTCVFVPM